MRLHGLERSPCRQAGGWAGLELRGWCGVAASWGRGMQVTVLGDQWAQGMAGRSCSRQAAHMW